MARQHCHDFLVFGEGYGVNAVRQVNNLAGNLRVVAEHCRQFATFLGRRIEATQARHVHFIMACPIGAVMAETVPRTMSFLRAVPGFILRCCRQA